MKNKISKYAKEVLQLLIDVTKTNTESWGNIKDLIQSSEISPIINQYQQEKMLDSFVVYSEKSSYVKINDTYFICFCLKNIISNATAYDVVMLSTSSSKFVALSQYDDENYSSRLANIIRFQAMKPEDIENEDDLDFIKSILAELQNS